MIKKDISYIVHDSSAQTQHKDISKKEDVSVDDIFAMADETMSAQNEAAKVQFKEKKKKRHGLRNTLIAAALLLFAFIVFLVVMGVRVLNVSYPDIKEGFLSQIGDMRAELVGMDDSSLSVDQYYQKQLLLLFSEDDLENILKNIEDIQIFSQMLEPGSTNETSLIPQDKIDAYNRIIDEYRNALERQEMSTTSTTSTTTTTD